MSSLPEPVCTPGQAAGAVLSSARGLYAQVQLAPERGLPFGGVGFHVFDHLHSKPGWHYDEVISRRWQELSPSFARMTDYWDMPQSSRDWLAHNMKRMEATGTQIYLTTWNPPRLEPGKPREEYAVKIADNLECLLDHHQVKNLRWYCMTNELTLKEWGVLRHDMETFRDYHRVIHAEITRRKLPIGLLATDASPMKFWDTLDWAAEHMDDITEVYGGHHYMNEFDPADPYSYPWHLQQLTRGVGIARAKGKPFIIGEFGAAQHQGPRDGFDYWDGCRHFDTPSEPLLGIQLAEFIIAALNAGVYAVGYWTFCDFPDPDHTRYANKWGLFRWCGKRDQAHDVASAKTGCAPRRIYPAVGLLTRHLRGPARSIPVTCTDPLTRVGAIQNDQGQYTFVMVHRNTQAVTIELPVGPGDGRRFHQYTWSAQDAGGEISDRLPGPKATLNAEGGMVRCTVGPGELRILTEQR